MKKMTWKHYLALASFLILATLLLIYKIGDQYMWTDEIFSFHTAKRILETGKPIYEEGLHYSRAPIYHQILAWSMQIFGENEFGGRILNIPFILGTSLLSFFFTKEITGKKNNSFLISLTTATLFITSTFSIAMVRETRMYAMLVFFFTLAIYAFYKSFISKKSTNELKIGKWEFRYNIPWIIIFLASFYISYNTQGISILLGIGILMYYIYQVIFKRKKEDILMVILLCIAGFLVTYLKYDTFNIYEVFNSLSPEWASNPPVLTYYPLLLARNFPGIFLLSPIIIFSIFKYRKKLDIFLFSIFSTYIVFMALQPAQHERYLQPMIPLLIILFVISIYRILKKIDTKRYRLKETLLAIIIFLVGLPHIYLLQKEVQEIDTYTDTSLSIHKKMEFNKLFEYLNTKDLNNYLIIADYHSAFTLYEKGYNLDYILVNEEYVNLQSNKLTDIYFHIPYTIYEKDFEKLVEGQPRIVITRDYEKFEGIEDIVVRYDAFEKPRVYR